MRIQCRRFGRLTNPFSKTLTNHAVAVSLHIAFYNLCRVHETTGTTPALALAGTDRVWSIGDLIDAALAITPDDVGRRRKPLKKPQHSALPDAKIAPGTTAGLLVLLGYDG